ncbi:beta-lactamase/transpeptidase-like protein [Thozetella sp. PMI_491]|nr:beta-lactamase/transpeptidase-like protein [Thozetella sp. PMI_491]
MAEAQKPLVVPAAGLLDEEFDKLVNDLLTKWHAPGIAIAVIDGEKTWNKGYGLAKVQSNTPVTPHTLFYGCSTTKAFTSAAVARLIETGEHKNPAFPDRKVDWKTPIADILPDDFVLQDEWATNHLTLEDALTHRSGMGRHDRAYGGKDATVKDLVRSMRHLPFNEPPRTKFQYCNLMYITASHAVQTLTGRGLGDVLKDWIWDPLEMNETFFDIDDARAAGVEVATGHYWHPDEKVFKEVPYMSMKEVSGAGAVISSVSDYAKWLRGLLDEHDFLPKAVHDTIKEPRIFESSDPGKFDAPWAYALGWSTTTYKGHRIWNHPGGSDGFGAMVTFIPALKFGVVTMSNINLYGNIVGEALTYKLIDDKIGLAEEKRADWQGWWQEMLVKQDEVFEKAEETIFPNLPQKATEPALDVESYTGTYFHPGWRNIIISTDGPNAGRRPKAKLIADRDDATWRITGELEHVTGEFWVMYSYFKTLPVSPMDYSPVEFKIGSDGKVSGLALEFGGEPMGQGEGVFTFKKIA